MLSTDPVRNGDDGGRPGRVFVGRQAELDAMAAALAAARAGEPQVVLVQGDGGIGKSSLIYEFLGSQPELPVIMASGEAAAAGADPELAGDLSAAAGRAADTGQLLLAARYLQQAAGVTERGPDRDERALSARW